MLRWCLNVFEKIVVKYLLKSLKIHTSRRRRLRESIRHKQPQFWHLPHDNAPAHRSNCESSIAGGLTGGCEKWLPIVFPEVIRTQTEVYCRPRGLLRR
ncbi:hypothetical protein TNCV_4686371 [Trichonephila clavipes]|nr:hypothetical protein TNCV_4686371 [Trichonephila clavipes]